MIDLDALEEANRNGDWWYGGDDESRSVHGDSAAVIAELRVARAVAAALAVPAVGIALGVVDPLMQDASETGTPPWGESLTVTAAAKVLEAGIARTGQRFGPTEPDVNVIVNWFGRLTTQGIGWARSFARAIVADRQSFVDTLVEAGVLGLADSQVPGLYEVVRPKSPHKHEIVVLRFPLSREAPFQVDQTTLRVQCTGCLLMWDVPNRLPIEVPT